jgi:hypothetical protein
MNINLPPAVPKRRFYASHVLNVVNERLHLDHAYVPTYRLDSDHPTLGTELSQPHGDIADVGADIEGDRIFRHCDVSRAKIRISHRGSFTTVRSVVPARNVSLPPPTTAGRVPTPISIADRASAQFSSVPSAHFSGLQNPSIGSCIVYYNGYSLAGYNNGPLDAGPAINLSGPSSKLTLIPSGDDDGSYGEFLGDAITFPIFIPDTGVAFNLDNGLAAPM